LQVGLPIFFQFFSKGFSNSSNLTSFLAPLALVNAVMGFAANSAQAAGFAGIYAPANWTQQIVQDGSFDTTNAPASITLIGPNNGAAAGKTDFTIAAPYAGQATFDWVYSTLDLDAIFDPFGYILNGTLFQLSNDALGNQSGSGSFSVVLGDTFGFSQQSIDSSQGAAQTTIGNYVAPIGGPSPASVPAPLPLVGAASAFGWSRQLRRRIKASV